MLHNEQLRFTCKQVYLKTEAFDTPFTSAIPKDTLLHIPVAHGEGNYYADETTLAQLEDQNQIVFRYVDADGNPTRESNPNGAVGNIAGICNAARNVVGMMPHRNGPWRPCWDLPTGSTYFESVLQSFFDKRRHTKRKYIDA